MARTAEQAHKRIDQIEPRIVKLETVTNLQFKEVFIRVKRLEAILIGVAGTIITMLFAILLRMG